MDSIEFKLWIGWWYNEVRKFTQEDVLLIMDNCGGNEGEIEESTVVDVAQADKTGGR